MNCRQVDLAIASSRQSERTPADEMTVTIKMPAKARWTFAELPHQVFSAAEYAEYTSTMACHGPKLRPHGQPLCSSSRWGSKDATSPKASDPPTDQPARMLAIGCAAKSSGKPAKVDRKCRHRSVTIAKSACAFRMPRKSSSDKELTQ